MGEVGREETGSSGAPGRLKRTFAPGFCTEHRIEKIEVAVKSPTRDGLQWRAAVGVCQAIGAGAPHSDIGWEQLGFPDPSGGSKAILIVWTRGPFRLYERAKLESRAIG